MQGNEELMLPPHEKVHNPSHSKKMQGIGALTLTLNIL